MLHLQNIVRGSLDVLADLMTMSGAIKKGPQDEHVKRSLKKAYSFLFCFPIEDILPSIRCR